MKNAAYLLVPVLCAMPLLEGCTTVATSLAGFGLKSMLDVRHSRETPETYYALGRYYQAQSRYDNAAKAYERALALKGDYEEAANALATAYAMQGRYDLAVERLLAAIEQFPQAAYLHNNLGYVYYLQRRYTEAIAALETAMRLEPGNARALRNLSRAQAAIGGDKSSTAVAGASAGAPGALPESGRMSEGMAAKREVQHTGALRPPTAASARSETMGGNIDVVPVSPSIYELRERPRVPSTPPANGMALAKDTGPIKAFRLEVSNSNGTSGMARRVAFALKQGGMNPVRLTNQKPWQGRTEIQYSEGHALEAAALARLLARDTLLIRNDRLRRDIKVRLVLGRDIDDQTAFVRRPDSAAAIAFAGP